MIHYGDIGDIDGSSVEPVDVVVGGSPCQDLSVAGRRAGMVKRCVCGYETAALSTEETCPICGSALIKTRSALFAEQIRIVKEMRDSARGKYPRYMLWENVSGALTSNKGEDFRAVLTRTAQVADPDADIPRPPAGKWPHAGLIMGDGWSIAWRLVDAQYWGVTITDGDTGDVLRMGTPQRRRRLSLVADFQGDTAGQLLFGVPGEAEAPGRAGADSGCEIYADPGGMSRHPTPDGETRKNAAGDNGARPAEASGAIAYGISAYNSNSMMSENPYSGVYVTDTAKTLDINGGNPACNQGGIVVMMYEAYQHHGYRESDTCGTLTGDQCGHVRGDTPLVFDAHGNGDGKICPTLTGNHQNRVTDYTAICIGNGQTAQGVGPIAGALNCMYDQQAVIVPNVAHALKAKANCDYREDSETYIAQYGIARRLTPLECERLQGYPIVRRIKTTIMTKDEYIAYALAKGHIIADTETGKVYATRGGHGKRLDTPKELTGTMANGYRVITIRQDKCKMQCRIHRIIWIAAHGIIPDGYVVDHINCDKTDNRLANLQLLTAADNSTKARKDGRYKTRSEAGRAKIADEVHDIIQYIYANSDTTMAQLSDAFGIAQSRVHQIIHDEPWTDIGQWLDSKGRVRQTTDTARYRALGNSICLPYWEFLARRMREQLGAFPTMASLFDGIAGFPLAFSKAGVKPAWSSEIDEFCNAVSKRRFPEEEA